MGQLKNCIICGIDKELTEFYFRKDSNTHRQDCKECRCSKQKEYATNNKEKVKESQKRANQKRWANPKIKEQMLKEAKEKYQRSKVRHKELRQKWYKENKVEYLEGRKKYYQEHKRDFRCRDARRRSMEISAMPNWVNKEQLKEFYRNCPKGMEVDHIVPLNNPNVCGLHVVWNLQYLTREENRSKGNKFIMEKIAC